ncbi:hypothetical protein GE09DRAFT_1041741 [Coniochaeta sp. 2T2.1]|nr:hypothetical protein GE09DRAFT_1041741 [Coniochaeta sp. 2T2.1]
MGARANFDRKILAALNYASEDPSLSTEQIKSVRIRTNKRGSRIAFVDFYRLSDATRFYDVFHPEIALPLQNSHGVPESLMVTIDYSRPREDSDRHAGRGEEQGWDCANCGGLNYPQRAVCYKCKAERSDTMESYAGYGGSHGGPILTGETDEDLRQNPSQFIVIRDLEPSVTEEVLAKGVMKLYREEAPQPVRDPSKPANKLKSTAPTNSIGLGASPGSLRRVFLIRDRRTNDSWRYGFAEFATIDDTRGAIAKFNASTRFTIASKPVIAAFIHTGVFVPLLEPVTDETANFSFAPIYNPAVRVKYWDERAYPSVHIVTAGPELAPADADANAAADDKAVSSPHDAAAKRKKDKEALAAKIAAKKALVMGPQMQMWTKKSAEIHGVLGKGTAEEITTPVIGDQPADSIVRIKKTEKSTSTDPVAPSWRDQYISYADWDTIECLLCGTFSNEEWLIYHETHTHDHYKDEGLKTKASALLAARSKQPRTIIRRTPRRKCEDLQPYTSYAHHDKLTCQLCSRKLPNIKMLRRHEQESELHKKNLLSPPTIEAAISKLATLGLKPTRMLPLGYDGPVRQGPAYRDRAKERRQVYSQPKKPMAAPPPASSSSNSNSNKRKPLEEPPAPEPEAKKSKGAGLLAKMGWTEGAGLGASGDGRKEAVGAEVYVPGVGLGAEGGKLGDATEEAARKMLPGGDFIEKTRERARERFERLQ